MFKDDVEIAFGNTRSFLSRPFNAYRTKWSECCDQVVFGNVPRDTTEKYFDGKSLVGVIPWR